MRLSDEEQFAYRLRQTLNLGTDQLKPPITQQLFKARQTALDHLPKDSHRFVKTPGASAVATIPSWVKTTMMAIALSIGIIGTYYWSLLEEAGEFEEIDSALLADEVPPNAYIDQGFHRWLERSSSSSAPQ